MDEGHRHLAILLNRLARDFGRSCEPPGQPLPGPGAAALFAALDELVREACWHLRREEEAMRA